MLFTKLWAGHRKTTGVLWYSAAADRVVTAPRAEGESTEHGSPKLERVMKRVMERAT